jgi:hypothetical protein
LAMLCATSRLHLRVFLTGITGNLNNKLDQGWPVFCHYFHEDGADLRTLPFRCCCLPV